MKVFTIEYAQTYTHKDGGIMGVKHHVLIKAETADDALNEARRQFGGIGKLSGSEVRGVKARCALPEPSSEPATGGEPC